MAKMKTEAKLQIVDSDYAQEILSQLAETGLSRFQKRLW